MPPPLYLNSKVFHHKFHSGSIRATGGDISKATIYIADEISKLKREKEFQVLLTATWQLHNSDRSPQAFFCHFHLSTRCL